METEIVDMYVYKKKTIWQIVFERLPPASRGWNKLQKINIFKQKNSEHFFLQE